MVRSIFGKLRTRIDNLLHPPPAELHVFLVRTGEYLGSEAPIPTWDVTEEGAAQAREAGRVIKRRIGTKKPTVFFNPASAASYRSTAHIIAEELGVSPETAAMAYVPMEDDLPYLQQFGGPIVIVVNGTALGYALMSCPGPDVPLGVLGPPLGSVHELVIKYRRATPVSACYELSREFI